MSNHSLQLFEYSGHQVRTVLIDDEPWFVLSDLADILDIVGRGRLASRLADDVRQTHPIEDSMGRTQQTTVVNEPGMYEVVLRSDKPEALSFRRWITTEVLPSIRKTGSYGSPAALTKSDLARMVIESEEEKAALAAELTAATPKAEAYDSFIGSDGTYSVGNVAKMLGTSQNKLFTELRNHGVLIGKGHMRNTPYQQYMHHFTVKAYSYTRSDGNEGTSYTTRVQPSGVDFIRKKLNLEEVAA